MTNITPRRTLPFWHKGKEQPMPDPGNAKPVKPTRAEIEKLLHEAPAEAEGAKQFTVSAGKMEWDDGEWYTNWKFCSGYLTLQEALWVYETCLSYPDVRIECQGFQINPDIQPIDFTK